MPRKPRIEFEGAFYHVITRGNQRQKIFRAVADNGKYLQILTNYKNRYHFHLFAYVLMENHIHLLMETGDTPLSKILQGINQSYTLYFNRRYKTVGHLFQGRYKAILCDRDNYLLALLKYIHQNPLRAGIAESPDAYRWSSHHAYTGKQNPLGLVDVDTVLNMFSKQKPRSRRRYRAFMDDIETLDKNEVYATVDQRIQGDEKFVDQVREKYNGRIKKEPKKKEYSLSAICNLIEIQFATSLAQLRSSGKDQTIMHARRIFAKAAKAYGYKGREIADYLKKDPASVTGYLLGEEIGSDLQKVMLQLTEGKKNVNSKV